MTDTPDLEKLAEQFIALWQQQLAAVAADDTLAESVMRMTHMYAAGAAAMGNLAPGAPGTTGATGAAGQATTGDADGSRTGNRAGADAGPAAGATAGGASPVAGGGELDDLRRRVDALEKRLAKLERGAGGGRGKSRGRSKGS